MYLRSLIFNRDFVLWQNLLDFVFPPWPEKLCTLRKVLCVHSDLLLCSGSRWQPNSRRIADFFLIEVNGYLMVVSQVQNAAHSGSKFVGSNLAGERLYRQWIRS